MNNERVARELVRLAKGLTAVNYARRDIDKARDLLEKVADNANRVLSSGYVGKDKLGHVKMELDKLGRALSNADGILRMISSMVSDEPVTR